MKMLSDTEAEQQAEQKRRALTSLHHEPTEGTETSERPTWRKDMITTDHTVQRNVKLQLLI